jgi:predicted Zn-dependent protease
MNLAQALFRQGNRAAAIAEIEEALKLDPDQPAARRLLNQVKP